MVLLFQSGCAVVGFIAGLNCPVSYTRDVYTQTGTDLTRYVVPAHLGKSPLGVPIGPGVDGKKVDEAFTSVARCLGVKFHACAVHAVLIAPDWFVVPGVEEQVFPCADPRPGASKLCTGVNQQPATIFLTPDMHMLRWEVERMLLGDDPNKDGGRECWRGAL
jgi:hypothetical protein